MDKPRTNNCVINQMLATEGPMSVERYVQLAWLGQKTVADLEGEEWCEVWKFQEFVDDLGRQSE